ncbi:uncharacterized protein LOC103523953 [Trichonephila clavipes]|nr:uncharacterized protein LOC103523953 [Trichonephila clavipes]
MCPKRLYTVCLETVVPVAEESLRDWSDAVLRLFLLAVTAKYIPVLIRRCNSEVTCAVTSSHISIILEQLPKPGNNTLGDSMFLGYFQLGTSTFQSSNNFTTLIRLPNNSFWRDYDSDGGRNLKTQKGFIQYVHENIQYKVTNDVPFELLSFANPLDYAILDIRLDLVLNVRKRDLSPTALHAIALETINTRFPPEEWLHIYTDDSLLDFVQGAGIGVFSHLFFYLHAGPLTTHFDGEVEAIHIAL